MCGIAGILGRPDRTAVERMMTAMARRGPDDLGLYEDAQVTLGHRRLSIIDLSAAGHQPMQRAGGRLWIVYNGEIYNHVELRRDLESRGHRFTSRSDTEVILALYEERGADCVERLRGMFAFAIWDLRGPSPLLFLARDHFGIKPLVYASAPARFAFASDLAAMMASGFVERAVDRIGLVQYLMHGHVVQPRTILAGVSMLPPAHVLTIRPGEAPQLRRYWSLDHARCAELCGGLSFADQAARVRWLLEAAARAQMVSDVPLGAFLSGGVDSSALVALMSRAAGRPIHTYSVGFRDAGRELDESADAERSARFLGAVHQAVSISGRDVADVIPSIASDLGQPTADGVNMHFVSRAARTGVTVALAGLGGDELFAGYRSFSDLAHRDAIGARLRRAPMMARWAAYRWLGRSTKIQDAWSSLWSANGFVADYASYRMVRLPEKAWRLAGCPDVDPGEVLAYAAADDPSISDPVSRVTLLESSLYMGSQLLRDADAASMAHSLEVRVPFLDVDLAEFVFGLPGASKLDAPMSGAAVVGKRVLLHAVQDLIPDWTWRKAKRGFTLPFGEWLRGPLKAMAEETFNGGALRDQGWLDADLASRAWRDFLGDPRAHWSRVWTILMLSLWDRQLLRPVVTRGAAPPARTVSLTAAHAAE